MTPKTNDPSELMLPLVSKATNAFVSNTAMQHCHVKCFSLDCHTCYTAQRDGKMLKDVQLQFTAVVAKVLFLALT